MTLKIAVLAGLVAATPISGFAEDMHNMHDMKGMEHKPAGGSAGSAGAMDKANMAAMDKMMQDMPKSGSGDADKDFITMMIPHHQGAIDMAKVELQYGTNPAMKKLAKAIIVAQEKEIAEMKAALAKLPK